MLGLDPMSARFLATCTLLAALTPLTGLSLLACSPSTPTPMATGGVAGDGGGFATGGAPLGSGGGPLGSGGNAAGGGPASGGASSGGAASGGAGGSLATGGSAGSGGADDRTGFYELPPPHDCHNRFFIDECDSGDPNSACGGLCQPVNACFEEGKTGEPGFICPRFMLFSDEMAQAAEDDAKNYGWSTDGESPFTYAVVGHDLDPGSALDSGVSGNTCCQCYQLIPVAPEQQASTLPLPKPMIVQSFNTGASTTTFDVFMGGGGLGAFDACTPTGSAPGHQYTSYPTEGQPFGGGISAVAQFGNGTACKDETSAVTPATLSSAACQGLIADACSEIVAADSPEITELTQRSCVQSNQPESLYHQNIQVLAKRVACPTALTRVTGCQLNGAAPAVDPAVLTAAQAQADGSFHGGYHTTTMQDCCKPTCAWSDNVTQATSGGYDSFYTCHADGVPLTE